MVTWTVDNVTMYDGTLGQSDHGTIGNWDNGHGDNRTIGQWDNGQFDDGTVGHGDNARTLGPWSNSKIRHWDAGTLGQW